MRRLRSTAPLSTAAAAAEHGAVVRDTAANGDDGGGGGGSSTALSSPRVGGGNLADGNPSRRSGAAAAMGSKSTSLFDVLEMGEVNGEEEEEEQAFNNDLRDGFTTPIYSDVGGGGARGDGHGRAAISTPSRDDGYTSDGEDGPDPVDGFVTPMNEEEDGFRTPVSRHSRML